MTSERTAGDRGRGGGGGWAWAAAGIGLVGAVAIFLATRSSFYYADDYLNAQFVFQRGLSWDLLKMSYFGTFAPGHRILDWTVADVVGLHWWYAQLSMLLFFAIAVAAMWRLCRQLVSAPVAFLAVASLALSPVWVRVIQWWANAEHIAPAMAATLVALAAGVTWLRTRRPGLLVLVGLAQIFSLCFYTKPVLTPLYFALIACFVRVPERLSVDAVRRAIKAALPLVGLTTLISVIYLVAIRTQGYSDSPGTPSTSTLIDFLKLEWTRGITPLLIGQTTPLTTGTGNQIAIVVAQVVLAALVIGTIARRPAAWRAWAAYLVIWLANVAIVAVGRVLPFGPTVGLDARYNAEFAFLLPLVAVLAWSAPQPGPALVSAGDRLRALAPARLALGGVAVALLLVSAIISFHRLDVAWDAPKARAWVERVEATAPAFASSVSRPALLDTELPYDVTPGGMAPYNELSGIARLLDLGGAQVGGDLGGRTLGVVEASGTTRRTVQTPTLDATPGTLARTRRLDLSQARGGRIGTGGRLCLDGSGGPALVTIAGVNAVGYAVADVQVAPGSSGVLFAYTSATPTGSLVGPVSTSAIPPGGGHVSLTLPSSVAFMRLDLQPGGRTCIERVRVSSVK